MHRIYLTSWSPHQTPSGQMLNLEVSIWPSSIQVLLYPGGAGQSSVVQSGIVLENWVGHQGIQLPQGSPTTSQPRVVYRQSVRRHGAGGVFTSLPP